MISADAQMPVTAILFSLTYIGLAYGRIPGLQTDRTGIAVIGMAVMLATGLISMKEASTAVDHQTLALLFGMMVLVAHLQVAGFFQLGAELILRCRPGPFSLLAMTMGLSGALSAFLVNDVVCVSLTPLIIDVCRRIRCNAVPHLIGLAVASNVGSVATITGNPQNMIIGSLSEISYLRFAMRLTPIALIGMGISYLVVAAVYRRTLSQHPESIPAEESPAIELDHRLLNKGMLVTVGVIILFFSGLPISVIALGAAAIMLAGRVSPEKIYRLIDWPLLVMFTGLFVVVHVFDHHVVSTWSPEKWSLLTRWPVAAISGLSVVLSNLVSNVPAVLLFKPIIAAMPEQEAAWLALAMSSTLAGNLTLLGSVANLIVVENARRAGTEISFLEYLKVGVPVTVLTTLVGIAWLQWVVY